LAIEAAALAARTGTAVAAALPAFFDPSLGVELQPSGVDDTEDDPSMRYTRTPPGPYAGQDFIPAPEVEETDEDIMAQVAMQDSGMIPEPSRVPEADPAQGEGFLNYNFEPLRLGGSDARQ